MSKGKGKSKIAAVRNNKQYNKLALEDETVIYGRTLKSLGNKWFRIQTTDVEGRSIETEAHLPGRAKVRIQVGDIIIVGRNVSSQQTTYEIVGACEKDTIKELKKQNRLHPSILNESGDDGLEFDIFERDEPEDEEKPKAEEGTAVVKKADKVSKHKERVLKEEDSDSDIDVDGI